MCSRKSKKRIELGEERWEEHQKERNKKKAKTYYRKNKGINGRYSASSYRIRVKQKLIKLKGGKCEKCGYAKDVARAFDFHHLNSDDKSFSIGSYKTLNWKKIKKEAKKCILVCKNCHAEIHDEEDRKNRKSVLDSHQKWIDKKLKLKKCELCSNDFQPKKSKQKYCSLECGNKSRRLVKRPTKEELEKLIEEMSWCAIGRIYNVSDNAIRKWARKYRII